MSQVAQQLTAARESQQAHRTLRLIRLAEVMHKTGMGRSWVFQAVKDGKFPAPISIAGSRAVGFIEHEVDSWIESRITASRNA